MNSAYKLFITTQKRNTHCVSFPLTQKGQCEAEEMFDQMKAEPTVTKLLLCRVDAKGVFTLKQYVPGAEG